MVQQVGDGGLAVGACDADPGAMTERLPGDGHLSSDGHTAFTQGIEGWMGPGNPWADHDLLDRTEPGLETGELQRLPKFDLDPLLVQGDGFALGRRVICTLQHDHFSTLRFEQPRGTDSRASEPDDDGAAHGLTPVPTREMGDTGIEPVTPTVSR